MEYDPDFIERNGTWVLSVLAVLMTCIGAMLTFFLRSRCSRIRCFCFECEREVVSLEPEQVSVSVK